MHEAQTIKNFKIHADKRNKSSPFNKSKQYIEVIYLTEFHQLPYIG